MSEVQSALPGVVGRGGGDLDRLDHPGAGSVTRERARSPGSGRGAVISTGSITRERTRSPGSGLDHAGAGVGVSGGGRGGGSRRPPSGPGGSSTGPVPPGARSVRTPSPGSAAGSGSTPAGP